VIRAVTGDLPPEERVERIAELENEALEGKVPVLVATDCLSEGIDLQHSFDAVIHYDLCWNPTRHEQREGRVDRFGQARNTVRALMLHGACKDPTRRNPVDERVLAVILNKEKVIRKELGVSVPVPGDANTITQAVLADVLGESVQQLGLDLGLATPPGMPEVLPLVGWEASLDQQVAERQGERQAHADDLCPAAPQARGGAAGVAAQQGSPGRSRRSGTAVDGGLRPPAATGTSSGWRGMAVQPGRDPG
jgi:hypothetical protein